MNRPEHSAREIGARLAAALGTLDEQTWRVTEHHQRVLLVSAGGDRLELHIRGYGPQAGRVIVRCSDPADARDVPMRALGATITVSPTRPAEQIAADVCRRLLRAYRTVRPAARAWRAADDALACAEGAVLDEAERHLGRLAGTVVRSGSPHLTELTLTAEHPYRGAVEQVRISQVSLGHEVTGPVEQEVPLGGGRGPTYARVGLNVHPRLLPALTRALAEIAATTDVGVVPPHQCPHTHEPGCPHGHDHLAEHSEE
ncbi:hypothetical protein Psed_6824 (plasmid) [Pseudonocardia dioxanivorans CB1190]|uniref:Uncharacterized protein n=1 Tax=Pseudonocardia dioxanivorans (strain ATCC 55486 / DSM 44775 / JCM 13855 / CB1190) TaxID=675635 RepID=F2L6K1_PSEUX|nr:hypothetical protein [Pseudonocardia dioxanivorans]AEA28895.1 hypothetical protein Psed_6824 [Pseudonocardia dioxanivorans CB1190]